LLFAGGFGGLFVGSFAIGAGGFGGTGFFRLARLVRGASFFCLARLVGGAGIFRLTLALGLLLADEFEVAVVLGGGRGRG
jgi:hypothetical protein